MKLSQVKEYVTGVLKQWFTNKPILDKFNETETGELLYGTKAISSNPVLKYQKYLNTELDSCHCKLSSPYTPVVGQYVPFIKRTGSLEVNNGYVIIKPGQRVQINVCISYHNTANQNPANISYDIKDYTNDVVIDSIHPVDIGIDSYEYPCTAFCQYTNKTNSDCKIGLCVNTIWTNDVIDVNYTALTVHEIGRQMIIDPVEHVNTEQGLEDTPVGHIISHMGTIAPKHYLICDGTEYNIADYPHLAQHMIDNFGSVNYFGGDGITTFAVPDLRGEFLRGSGTATRDTGSGADVGKHQNPTIQTSTWSDSYKNICASDIGEYPQFANVDKYYYRGGRVYISGKTDSNVTNDVGKYSARPTNTSVLYCIKYEPTYYTKVNNTNYLSASLYSEKERIIGCWIDGKPLYKKTIIATAPSKLESGTNIADVSELNIDTMIDLQGCIITTANSNTYTNVINACYFQTWFRDFSNTIAMRILEESQYCNQPVYITIKYTKTTDNENSFTNDMIKDYIVSSENHEPSYTDEEINSAILEAVAEINEEV